jgi:putative Mg2+ transporter-C (MgtC) family protein
MNLISSIPVVKLELLGLVNYYLAMGLQISMAVILGGFVGYERETRMKSAGVKTNIMICLGACVFTAISLINYNAQLSSNDPNRIAAQIVSGIGFLGAGAIIQSKGGVIGLTTAATIWMVAAIGVTVGMGYPFSAAMFTLTVLVVLKVIDPLLKKIRPEEDFQLILDIKSDVVSIVEDMIEISDASIHKIDVITTSGDRSEVHCYLRLSKTTLKKLLFQFRQLKAVKSVLHRDCADLLERS